jgi:hypothetical protein
MLQLYDRVIVTKPNSEWNGRIGSVHEISASNNTVCLFFWGQDFFDATENTWKKRLHIFSFGQIRKISNY